MTLRSAGLAVAVGSPMFALYILGVLLLLDLESASGQYALAMPVALFLGFVPWGFLINQVVASGQLPDRKSTSGWLSGLITVLDVGKGALAVTLGWAAIDTSEGTMAAGLAVLAGHTAASLVFRHGRAGPVSVGALLVMAWLPGTIAVASVPLAILAVRRGLPGGVLVASAMIVATLVLALVGQTEHIYVAFVGPAAALMLFQYRKKPPPAVAIDASDPIPPAST